MKRNLEHWTQHYLGLGFGLIEARQKAEKKIAYLQECETLKPSANKVDNGMYRK